MTNKCPNCKAEVKEGYKFCLSCGAPLQTVGAADTQNFESQVAPPSSQPQQPTPPPPPSGQTYGQTQTYAPMQPKKTNMKLIGSIIAIIVIIVVVALVVFLFIGGGGIDSNLVGSWEYTEPTSGMSIVYIFNSDGSLEMGIDNITQQIGTWRVNGGQLCIESIGQEQEQCVSYSLSSDGSQLTFHSMTFNKK